MKHLKGDIFGGMTVAIVALPLALAFGVQSGLGAVAGLYGSIALGLVAAMFGGTASQISGPTGPTTLISSLIVASCIAVADSQEKALYLICLSFLLVGLVQIGFALMKIGKYVKYISYPVLSGFMSGVGIMIIALQLFPLVGIESPKKVLEIISMLPILVENMDYQSLILGGSTIVIIYLFPYLSTALPSTLVALLVMSVATLWLGWEVPIIGDIPKGLPEFKGYLLSQLEWSDISFVIGPAVTLAAIASVESLLSSVVADNITKCKHDSNRELMGQGVANMCASLIGGIPGAGATIRTVVNLRAGGSTRFSGALHAIFLLLILLFAEDYAEKIPLPVLAGILFTVGVGVIDYRGFRHLKRIPRADAVVMLLVLGMTVFVDLLQAVVFGMVLGSLLFIKKMGDISEEKTSVSTIEQYDEAPWDDELGLPADLKQRVYIKHLYGPLFFGFASQIDGLVRSMPNVAAVVIRMEHVPYIDQTGLYAIESAVMELTERNVEVAFSGLQVQPRDMFEQIDLIPELVPVEDVFTDFKECMQWFHQKLLQPSPESSTI